MQANHLANKPGRTPLSGLPLRSSLCALVGLTVWLGPGAEWARADKVLTIDGRLMEVSKARPVEGGYTLIFEHGEVFCPSEAVKSVEVEGDMSDYVPQNDNERQKLEDGYIRYKGKWWKQVAYENELRKQAEISAERTADLAAHAEWRQAYELETKHFLMRSNTSPEILEYYAGLLEQHYANLNKQIPIKPPPELRRTKMTVNIYKSPADFYEYAAGGAGPGVLGYFWPYDNTLNFYHDFQEPGKSEWVALHECTHLLTYLIDPQFDPPIWINEALADFNGSARVTRDAKGKFEIEPGQLQTDRILTVQQAMKSGSDRKLKELIQIRYGAFGGFEYAHAWSFVYFLHNSKKQYKQGFEKLFRDLYTVKKGIEYSWEADGGRGGTSKVVPPAEIRRLLLKYLKVDSLEPLEQEWKAFVAAIEIDTPEALFKRGYRAVSMAYDEDEEKQAMEDLDAAIAGGIEDARAYSARGQLHSRNGSRRSAIADFRKAVELAPLNPGLRFALGRELSGYWGFFQGNSGFRVTIRISRDSVWELDGTDEENEEARLHFGLAMEMDPANFGYERYYQDYLEALERHSPGTD